MNLHRITTLALVFSVLFTGCSAIDPPTDPGKPTATKTDVGNTPTETDGESTPTATSTGESEESEESTPTATTTTTGGESTTTTTTTKTTTEETTTTTIDSTPTQTTSTESGWSTPKPPTRPTEEKLEKRITSTEFVNKVQAESGSGYSDFDVQIRADTRLKNVDPEGDVDGEPYFIIEINDKLVARASVTFEQNGSFAIEIPPAALKQFESGTLTVRVSLLEQDSHSDDLYDTWSGTIEYSAS